VKPGCHVTHLQEPLLLLFVLGELEASKVIVDTINGLEFLQEDAWLRCG
jgi:hypothetical protein